MRSLDLGRSRLTKVLVRTGLLASVVALAVGVGPVQAHDGGRHGDDRQEGRARWGAVREATEAYRDLATAQAAGYGLFPGCFDNPAGGMGVHYVKFSSVGDGVIDPLDPEAMVYEPTKDGGFRLGAVEYIVIAASWTGSRPPEVLGHPLDFVDSPNEFGLPPFYELHVWLYKSNPSGMFTEWNPRVTCKYAR